LLRTFELKLEFEVFDESGANIEKDIYYLSVIV
jgi:hypothetical protein